MEFINVLSLFDGMSCGQIALERTGIKVEKYYASEIDPLAKQITQKNYPNTIQLGDVREISSKKLPKINLLIGGSPCQGFSIAGKKLNFEDDRSKLFFEYVRILNEVKPEYFLLENVRMPDKIADAIDELLGVKRVFIDSRDFTGHIRKRYYWTNIPINQWESKDLKIKDIIDDEPFDRDLNFFLDRTEYNPNESFDGIITINPRDKNGKQTWQRGRVYDIRGNCPTICASLFDLNITEDHKTYRKLTINECEKLQGIPKDYTLGVPKGERGKMLGNGWTVDVISHIFRNIK
ncbi:DNA (cytosine-5-)-methyltransferase [Bacillus infantis]|uniref:DNA (cytosine-5-)-methyltransferase n=1 Tax=Bacillus infantis TaxID=324767 RepID=UPI00209E999B|nr:DNA (cytosine-5-)-methyltransferase [Bacillus infantis]MCP1159283.1 DNA (cytosine-5-)-methyltransferase [Bacillus infantis]